MMDKELHFDKSSMHCIGASNISIWAMVKGFAETNEMGHCIIFKIY